MRIDARRIAIVRLGSIGDVVNTLPLLNRLRVGYPHSHITWIVEEKSAPILGGHPALDDVMVFPRHRPHRWLQFVKQLRAARFDLLLDCQRMMRSGLLAILSGATHRIGFDRARCREGNWLFTDYQIPPNDRPGVTVERYLEFADFLEIHTAAVSWNIAIGDAERQKVSGVLGRDRRLPIVINVGASKHEKLWPAEHVVRLARHLAQHWGGPIVLTGGSHDRERARLISTGLKVLDTTGIFTLKELAVLLEQSALVVSADTGPLHLAVAMGTPIVGLYGPSDPQRTGPYGQADWILVGSGGSQCRSCRRWCGNPYTPCMSSIVPEMVFDTIEKRLAGHPLWIP